MSRRRVPRRARDSIKQYSRREPDEQVLEKLLEQVRYVSGTFDEDSVFERLEEDSTSSTRTPTRVQPDLLPLDVARVLRR